MQPVLASMPCASAAGSAMHVGRAMNGTWDADAGSEARLQETHQRAGPPGDQHHVGVDRRVAERRVDDAPGVSGRRGMPGTSSILR